MAAAAPFFTFCRGEIYTYKGVGFCPIGEGGKFIESGKTMLEGRIPVNTPVGLVSRGHPKKER